MVELRISFTMTYKKHFKSFYDISKKTDEEILNLSHKIGLDIAVNLTGYTAESRNEIYQKKSRSCTDQFCGLFWVYGVDFIDYIIADSCLIPKEKIEYYTEKVIYMPGSFFPNQSQIKISSKKFHKRKTYIYHKKILFWKF